MWCLHPDLQITRRGRLFALTDDEDVLQWTGPAFLGALEHLHDQGQTDVLITSEDISYRMTFSPIPR